MRYFWVIVFAVLLLWGCGGIRYSEISPEVKDFHPRNIGVFPAEIGSYADAKGIIDRIVSEVLVDKGWFASIVGGDAINKQISESEEIGKTISDYLSKYKNVSYSDPDLSKRIGELLKIDAFLFVDLAYWNYTTMEDDKVAKVEAELTMINANTGQILWKAHHYEAETYTFLKPQLPKVARSLVKKMISEMPH
jgi:hypothetical protein